MTESGQVTNRNFWDFLVSLGDSGYLLKDESFIEGELRRFESYLGFRLSARREVGEYERTRRSASREISGNFSPRKTWSFFAPTFGRSFMRPPGSQQMSRHMLHHLQEGLGLTEAQMKQVQPLVEKTGRDLEVIRRETTRRVVARVEASHAEISKLLTPEQQAKFEKMKAESREHLRRGHPPLGLGEPPSPPPPNDR